MMFDNTKIKEISLYNVMADELSQSLKIVINDNNDYNVNITFTLYKRKYAYIIRNTYITFNCDSELNNILPYFYEGLTKTKNCISNALEGFSLTEGDLLEYEV